MLQFSDEITEVGKASGANGFTAWALDWLCLSLDFRFAAFLAVRDLRQ